MNLIDIYVTNIPEKGVPNDQFLNYHYILEASKFSNSHLMNLGDPDFNETAHVVSD